MKPITKEKYSESCFELSNRCELFDKYSKLMKDTNTSQKRIREIKKILNMNIQDEPTKIGYTEILKENQEKLNKNKELILQMRKSIKCK